MSEEATESRDDTAAASPRHTLAGRVTPIRNRSAIEDDEKLTAVRCRA
jgi:hypothetical protein